MKLVKAIVILMAVLLIASPLAAQQKISFLGQIGYGLGLGGEHFATSTTYDASYDPTSEKDHYLSMGKGLTLDLGAEMSLNPNFDARLTGGYSMMPSLEVKTESPSGTYKSTYKGHIIALNAILIAKAQLGTLHPYVGMGPGLYLAGAKREDEGGSTKMTTEMRFKPAIGFSGLLGLEFLMSGNLTPFVELNLQQVGLTEKEYEVTKYTVNGVDHLANVDLDPSTPGVQHTITYERDSIDKDPPPVISGSNLSIRVGAKITI
jgi:opacity protein-like surface antigen